MKLCISCFLFILIAISGKSQDSTTTLSRFEDFISKPGKVIKPEMMIAGQYGPYKVLKYIATDITTGMCMYAVRVDNNYSFDFPIELIDPKAVYIDSVDLDTFIATAESFLRTSDSAQLPFNTKFSYLTSTDVQLSCYFTKLTDNWSFEIDKVYQKLRTHISGTSLVLNKKRMQQLVNLLRQAKSG